MRATVIDDDAAEAGQELVFERYIAAHGAALTGELRSRTHALD